MLPLNRVIVVLVIVLVALLSFFLFRRKFQNNLVLSHKPSFNTQSQIACSNISEEKAVNVVKSVPEVKEFMSNVVKLPDGNLSEVVEVAGLTGDKKSWRVHVYHNQEINPPTEGGVTSMTQTFNWFQVNKCTGKISCVDVDYSDNKSKFPVCTGD